MNDNDRISGQQPDLSLPFSWWPPEFPGVHRSAEEDEPREPASDPTDEDALGARLARSYEIIEQQRTDIRRLTEQAAELEEALAAANTRTRRTRRRWSLLVKAMVLLPCLGAGVVFHREVAQVGWNFFCGACGVFGIAPTNGAGLLTAAAAALLLWKVGKAVFRAALEDLFDREPEEEEEEWSI